MNQIQNRNPFEDETMKLSGHKIIIWGTSMGAVNMYKRCIAAGMADRVMGFTDSVHVRRENKVVTFCGKPIYSHAELQELYGSIDILLGTKSVRNIEQIMSTLLHLGFTDNIFADSDYSSFPLPPYQLELMQKNRNKIQFVYDHLADELSQRTLETVFEYRQNGEVSSQGVRQITDPQWVEYYPDFLPLRADEVFVDCGAYDGDTILQFVAQVKGNYRKIFGFEADQVNCEIARQILKLHRIDNCIVYGNGVYDRKETLYFSDRHDMGSGISQKGKSTVEAVALDEVLGGEEITFIKMDIEGAEMKALKGAEKIISKQRPKLAICIYHLENDLWEIPYFILNTFENYKIYIRHYQPENLRGDTILYAIPM